MTDEQRDTVLRQSVEKMKFQITSRWTGSVLFELETDSIRLCVEAAVAAGVNLDGANLDGANLDGANLDGAILDGANLDGAILDGARLAGANLIGASLIGARLIGARLDGANLDEAILDGARLDGANLVGARLVGASHEIIKTVGRQPLLAIGPIGSRESYLYAWHTIAGIYIRTGCFWNTLAEFRAAVEREHGTNEHGQHYRAAIALIEARFAEAGVASRRTKP